MHRASRAAALGGHVAAAASLGALAGLLMFVFEAAIPYRGHYVLLGDPLTRVLSIYLLSAIAASAALGLLTGAAGALLGRLLRPADYLRFHTGAVFFGALSFWYLRKHSLSAVARLWSSSDGLVILGLLVAATAVALGCGRMLARRRALHARYLAVTAVGPLLIVVALLWLQRVNEHRLPGLARKPADGPNVVFIVMDALRPDHLSTYGYHRATSPNIDRLADEGVVFLNARSHGPRTVLAMPAVFTSLYPSFHGAISLGPLMRPLPAARVTIAELFQQAGYTSVGLMTNIYLKSIFGMTQGFDRVTEFNAGCYQLAVYRALQKVGLLTKPDYAATGTPAATELTDSGLEWLDRLQDRPFFLYLHYMDTHHPYVAPDTYERRFRPSTVGGQSEALFRETVRLLKEGRQEQLGSDDLDTLRDYYDATILYADHEIGRILERVRRIAKEKETIVVITADHGDEFLEHGNLYHNNPLMIEELIRVPLIVWNPSRYRGRRVDSQVRHIDILPTLAGLIGQPVPEEAMGTSLEPLLDGSESDLGLVSITEGDFSTALIRQQWKIVYVDSTETVYLYNLENDPRETQDLSSVEPDVTADLMRRLDLYLEKARDVGHQREAPANPETIRQLKALGYL